MENHTDEQLMAGLMSGHIEALGVLVERHHGPLLGYLYRMLSGDRTLAEDLAQETFVKVMQQSTYRADRAFKPWLYAIATNIARDYFKSAEARRVASPGEMPDVPDESHGPEESVLAGESQREIVTAIALLSVEYRAALLMRFYGGMSLQEISLALGVPLGTVKSRLTTGCRLLRGALARGYERVE